MSVHSDQFSVFVCYSLLPNPYSLPFSLWRDVRDGQIPVCGEDLKSPLLFALVRGLVRPELLDQGFFVWIRRGCEGRVFVCDCDAVVPAPIFGSVISRRLNLDVEHTPGGLNPLQKRIVVLEKEIEELPLMAPLHFVVVLDRVRLIGAALRRSSLCRGRCRKTDGRDQNEKDRKNLTH